MSHHNAPLAPFAWLAIVSRTARGIFRQIFEIFAALEGRREVRYLAELDDRMLKDIGLARSDVDGALSEGLLCNPSVHLVRCVEQRERASSNQRRPMRPTVPVRQVATRCG